MTVVHGPNACEKRFSRTRLCTALDFQRAMFDVRCLDSFTKPETSNIELRTIPRNRDRAERVPQIRFALSRGLAVSGKVFDGVPGVVALPESRSTPG